MCNPALIVGAAVTAVSAIRKGQEGKEAADDQAVQIDYSAKVARDDAQATAQIIRKQQKSTIGSADAAAAASGIVVGEGSSQDAERQIYQDSEHDAFTALLNGERRARGLETESALTTKAGNNAAKNGYFNAAASVLSSASKMYGQGWSTAKA